MQIIKPYLGVNAPLLGARNYLGMKNGFLFDSHNYNPYLGVFKPLTNDSRLLGDRKHKPLIDEDVWNGESWNDDFLEIVDFIPQQDNQETTTIVSNLLSDPIESNINIEISEPLKNQKKSTSKSKSKSQTKTKPKTKSSPASKKRVNSSVAKQIDQSFPENSTSINLDDERLLKTGDFLPIEPDRENIVIHESLIESEEESEFIPLIENLPQIEDTDILYRNLTNNDTLLNLPNVETLEESLTEESGNVNLPNNINKSSETKPFLSTPKQIDFLDNYKLSRELTNNEQLVTPQSIVMPIIQASESDILTTSTTPKDPINQLSETTPIFSTLNPSLIEKESTILENKNPTPNPLPASREGAFDVPTVQNQGIETEYSTNELLENTSLPTTDKNFAINDGPNFAEISTNNTEENSRINDDRKDEFREHFT